MKKYHCVHGMHLLFLYFVKQCILALSRPYMGYFFLEIFIWRLVFDKKSFNNLKKTISIKVFDYCMVAVSNATRIALRR